jgi:hypothetical protein
MINKMSSVHTMEYDTALKKEENPDTGNSVDELRRCYTK